MKPGLIFHRGKILGKLRGNLECGFAQPILSLEQANEALENNQEVIILD